MSGTVLKSAIYPRTDAMAYDWGAWESRNSVTILTRRTSNRHTSLELVETLSQEDADAAAADLPGTGEVTGL